jgi:hypothetical protein
MIIMTLFLLLMLLLLLLCLCCRRLTSQLQAQQLLARSRAWKTGWTGSDAAGHRYQQSADVSM